MASPRELVVVMGWIAYVAAVSAILAAERWEAASFLLFLPAAIALGVLVPRWPIAFASLPLSVGLGLAAFEIACPCYENGIGYFLVWWIVGFGVPSAAVASGAIAIRRSVDRRRWPL
jgi:hypothetical protein